MKCENSAFNAQGSRVILVVAHVGAAVKKYVAAVEEHRKKGKDRMKLSLSITKNWWKNWFGSQLFHFVKFSFSVTRLMPCYAKPDCSRLRLY
jgi:hypothetical protein